MWSAVKWCELTWYMWSDFVLTWGEMKWSEVKWVMLKLLGTKATRTLGWLNIEGVWLYFEYIIWCVFCAVVVLTCFVICDCAYVWVLLCMGVCIYGFCNMWMCVCVRFVMCGYFVNRCTCIYCVFVLYLLCIFILICYKCKE
jgi:hypothetical protein